MERVLKMRNILKDKKGEHQMTTAVVVIIGALILTALLQGFRTTAIKSALDASEPFTVTSTGGAVYNFTSSGISGQTTGLIYNLLTGLVWLIAVVTLIFSYTKFKHG